MKHLRLPLLCALAMSVGWGVRGDYGHEAGAMVPGALVALAACLGAQRADWWARGSVLAFLGAVGWSFGGSMSYGRIIGYTAHSSFPDVAYGYACLFVIGALWGGVGAGLLGLGLTRPRSALECSAIPLVVLYVVWKLLDVTGVTRAVGQALGATPFADSDTLAAISALGVALIVGLVHRPSRSVCLLMVILAGSWLLGYGLLRGVLEWRMTPPRSDNWAGCLGLFLGLMVYLLALRERAALVLLGYGVFWGGVGFAIGDLLNMLGRAGWGPIGAFEALQGLGYWKWMEQSFGFLMGAGVGLGFLSLIRASVPPPVEDVPPGALRGVALVFLLIVVMAENLSKNVGTWVKGGQIRESLFGWEPQGWFLLLGGLLLATVLVAIVRHQRSALPLVPSHPLGRAQLLFLLLLWVPILGAFLQAFPGMAHRNTLLVHGSFWLTGIAATLIVLLLPETPAPVDPPRDLTFSRRWVWSGLLVPGLILLLAWATTASHTDPLPGSHQRFAPIDPNAPP